MRSPVCRSCARCSCITKTMHSTYSLKYQYLLGRDILVAPVHEEGRSDWTLYLPEDNWVHAWTGEAFRAGKLPLMRPSASRRSFIAPIANGRHCSRR